MEADKIESVLKDVISKHQSDVDESIVNYMAGMLAEEHCHNPEQAFDLIGPFLLDMGCAKSDDEGMAICQDLMDKLSVGGVKKEAPGAVTLLNNPVVISNITADVSAGYVDPFLGMVKPQVNFNVFTPLGGESKKNSKQEKKDREAVEKKLQEWKEARKPLPAPMCVHRQGEVRNRDIIIERFSLILGGKPLLDEASLKLSYGRRYGLIGRNGVGKTTLLNAMARREIDGFPSHLNVLHVEQEVVGDDRSPLDWVLETDLERTQLLKEEKELLQSGAVSERLAQVYNRLEEIDANSAPAKASTILAGLGFTPEMQLMPTRTFSGGWRMRIALARALFAQPDVLLLDEPTNHLDLEAVVWLENYLCDWDRTLVVVSHAREFLNTVVTDIFHFNEGKLDYYRGNYDQFEKTRAEHLRQQRKQFEAQQMHIAHVQKFIDRFRYNAKRASLVQSRLKQLQKLELVEEVSDDPSLVFRFPTPEAISPPVLQLEGATFGYTRDKILFSDVDFTVDLDSRIAVVGPNGAGKTTLLKVLTGELEALSGHVKRHNRLRIALFTQHHVDQLELTLNSVEMLMKIYPDAEEEEVRSHLGSFGVSGPMALQNIFTLSGGQKSRVAFAIVSWRKPHIMILDEPTNHLDLDAVNALILALNSFDGGVVVVSHDQHLISSVCDDIWHVEKGRVNQFKGDFEEYKATIKIPQ